MGRQPRSGDFPWLSAHSILNWIGGDTQYANPVSDEVKTYMQESAISALNQAFSVAPIALFIAMERVVPAAISWA